MRISLKSCSGCCCLQLLVPSTCWTLCPQVILLWAKPAGLTPNPGHANPAGLSGRAQKPRRGSFLLVVLSGQEPPLSEQQPRAGRQKKLPIPMDVAVCKDNSCLLFSRVMLTQQSPHPADAFPYAQNCPTFVQPLDCISKPSSPISQPFLLS